MIRTILVPLDGSTFGEHALSMAATLARRAGATLHLVHVHEVMPPATVAGVVVMDSLELHLRQDEQAYLADTMRRLREKGPIEVRSALLEGDVSTAVQAEVARIHADLVVMCTHGRGALGRFWLGSVTDSLVREQPRPVLLVHPNEGKPELKHEPDLSNILLPLDGTPEGEQVLEPALTLGKLLSSTLNLVRVVRHVLRTSYLPGGGTIAGMEHSALAQIYLTQKHAEEQAQAYLDGVAGRLRQQGCAVHTCVVVNEQPAAGILLEAQVRHAGLIALATHGRRGLSRLLLGSVADKIIHGTEVPVLVHRQVKVGEHPCLAPVPY